MGFNLCHRKPTTLQLVASVTSVLFGVAAVGPTVAAQELELNRTSLLYGLGSVEHVSRGSAVVDVGQVQTLKVDDQVVLIRQVSNYFVPVGVLPIRETYPTFSRTGSSRSVTPEVEDIVLFVREFHQIRPPEQYESDLIRHRLIQNAGTNRSSSRRRQDAAMAMLGYRRNFAKWEKSSQKVAGYLPGASYEGDGHERLDLLLSHIGMMRDLYESGADGLAAAGPGWEAVVLNLAGPAVLKAHQEALEAKPKPDEFATETGPSIRDIRRVINVNFYDRLEEEKNLLAFLVATVLDLGPRNEELWMQHRIERSQFPAIAEEPVIFEHLQQILLQLRGEL